MILAALLVAALLVDLIVNERWLDVLLLILIVVLLVFGTSKLPQLGDALGRGIRNFKKSVTTDDAIDVTPEKDKDKPPTLPPTSPDARTGEQAAQTTPAKK